MNLKGLLKYFKGKRLNSKPVKTPVRSRETLADTLKQYLIALLISSFLFFVACTNSSSDVKLFIQNTKTRKPKPVQPIPEFKKFEPYPYTAQDLRNPFEPFITAIAVKLPPNPVGPGPDLKRPKEILESYPLDSLRMVGTLARTNKTYALVKDSQGIIHRVHVGNYMGQNFGKIQKITDSFIEIREWAVTPQGKYEERTVIMNLSP